MKILIYYKNCIPVQKYGGTERVVWYLGKELIKLGHQVTYLVKKGSTCDFADLIPLDPNQHRSDQMPRNFDMIHCHGMVPGMDDFHTPHVHTIHGNEKKPFKNEKNVIFVSKNHANRYGVDSFVYNGMDWSDYGSPDLSTTREYFHFLAKAAWRVKNVQGAINAIKATRREHLKVLGGNRLNFNMGFRWTFTRRASFCGMVADEEKKQLLSKSKGLIFPVRWHEPFGLAIIESLYFGCPIFGTHYGSLEELVTKDIGFLTNNQHELTQAIESSESYSKQACHEYARDHFNSRKMALGYLKCYQRVLDGESLNKKVPQLVQHEPKYLEWHTLNEL